MKRSRLDVGAKSRERGSTFKRVDSGLANNTPAARQRPGAGHQDRSLMPARKVARKTNAAKRNGPHRRGAILQCAQCGEEFYVSPSEAARGRKYCGQACMGAASRKQRVCTVCGTSFTSVGNGNRKTCSRECANEAISRAHSGDKNAMRNPAVATRVSLALRARQARLNSDLPPERKTCLRPGCANLIAKQGAWYCSPRCHYDDRGSYGRGRKQAQAYHRCAACREVFAWNGAGKGACCSSACASSLGPHTAAVEVVEVEQLRGHKRETWITIPLGHCSQAGCSERAIHRHHVVFSQHVVRVGGDRWDPRNALTLCQRSHAFAHGGHLSLTDLRDENYVFAVELLGAPAAYEYLRRRYSGRDERLERVLHEGLPHPMVNERES